MEKNCPKLAKSTSSINLESNVSEGLIRKKKWKWKKLFFAIVLSEFKKTNGLYLVLEFQEAEKTFAGSAYFVFYTLCSWLTS